MERLVTQSDLDKYPDLISKGVSVNQLYDFTALEATDSTPPEASEISTKHIKKTGAKVDDENNPKTIDPKDSKKK